MDAAATISMTKSVIALFLALSSLRLTAYRWPAHVPVQDKAKYDYVVVGSGTAGSVIANRLSENPAVSVLLIEAGGDPQWEADYAGLMLYLTKSTMDWNYVSEDDGYSAQYHRNKYLDMPAGKVLGGSSTIHHLYYVRGVAFDYGLWAKAAGTDKWSWWNLLPYFKKSERIEDPGILNSETSWLHGKDGLVGITRDTRSEPLKYLDAFAEVGHRVAEDMSTDEFVGFSRALLYINKEGIRQSSAECFLATAKKRTNLHIMKNTMVTKVLLKGNNAIGVEASTPAGLINVYARKETILSAGVFNTPKILMLSGIGPKEHLESLGIPVVTDLPVGQNMEDHTTVIVINKFEKTNDTTVPQNPSNFPGPTFVGTGALDKKQRYPDWLTLNVVSRNNPALLLQLSCIIFGLHDDVCNQIAAAGTGHEVLFTVMNKCRPLSFGRVLLRSTDPRDPPRIYGGHFSNSTDLQDTAQYIMDFIRVTRSSQFQKGGGETVYLNLPQCNGLDRNTIEYWKCYSLNVMDTTYHYSSTCRMGSVLDSNLKVLGINKLRVGDASAMPNQVSGNSNTAVMVLAEKLADLIKQDNKVYNKKIK